MGLPLIRKKYELVVNRYPVGIEADEIKLPEETVVTEAWIAGTMTGEVAIDMGAMEALSMEITMAGDNQNVLDTMGITGIAGTLIRFIGGHQADDTGVEMAETIICRGRLTKNAPGAAKRKTINKSTYTYDLAYYQRLVNGKDVRTIDPINGIDTVNGESRAGTLNETMGLA